MRRLLACLMLPLLLAARPAAADLVYVLNSTDPSISILDAFTRQELRRIPALREVHHLVLSPDGRDLLIADSGANEILFVDPATGDVRRRERISNPYHLDFSPDGRHLVVASLRRNQVDIYEARTLSLLARLRMPDKPSHIAFRPDASVVYVTLQGSGTVAAISLETREPLWEAPVGREPAGIIWHRGRLIVGIMGTENFVVLNPETREIEREIPVGRGASGPPAACRAGSRKSTRRRSRCGVSTRSRVGRTASPSTPMAASGPPCAGRGASHGSTRAPARSRPSLSGAARTASSSIPAVRNRLRGLLAAVLACLAAPAAAQVSPACPSGTLYLTIDTGWGREAERIAAILKRRDVRATLFVAHERTHTGERSLDPGWAAFWRARAAEGHVFATHTDRHWYFRADVAPGRVRYVSRTGEGEEVLDQAAMCRELAMPVARLREAVPDAVVLPLWRAPGGITTPGAIRLGEGCGLRHQGWTANGFLGDELPSDAHPNRALAARTLRSVRDGEVLVMHWGIRSRREPYAEVLEEVIMGLQSRGFCFATLPPEGRR